jgi:hypothetical protein
VLFLAGGVTGLVLHEQKISDFNSKTVSGTTTRRCMVQGSTVVGGDDCTSLANSANNWQTVEIVGFAVGGVLAAGAVVLQLIEPRPSGAAGRDVGFSCSPTVGRFGAVCAVRF